MDSVVYTRAQGDPACAAVPDLFYGWNFSGSMYAQYGCCGLVVLPLLVDAARTDLFDRAVSDA